MKHLQVEITQETCPKCGGPAKLIGILFESVWSRCQHCGREFMAGHTSKTKEQNYAIKI